MAKREQCNAMTKMDLAHNFATTQCRRLAVKDGLCTIHQPHYVSPRTKRFYATLEQREKKRRIERAAPDLLEACKAALADEPAWAFKVEAAIAKAEGK